MKKIIAIILITVLAGCQTARVRHLKTPVVVVAIDPFYAGHVTVRDMSGRLYSYSGAESSFASSIMRTYSPGDTIR